jgi:hypothetical protein
MELTAFKTVVLGKEFVASSISYKTMKRIFLICQELGMTDEETTALLVNLDAFYQSNAVIHAIDELLASSDSTLDRKALKTDRYTEIVKMNNALKTIPADFSNYLVKTCQNRRLKKVQ